MRTAATLWLVVAICALWAPVRAAEGAGDLGEIRGRGVLRHLAVPCAGFVGGAGDGFDVELVREFARRLGVAYELVPTRWSDALPDLTGRRVSRRAPGPGRAQVAPVRGDLLASGLAVVPWRTRAAAYSAPLLTTQVWAVAVAGSQLEPIRPSGRPAEDVAAVRGLAAGRRLLGVAHTALDPALYGLDRGGAEVVLLDVPLDDLAAALIQGEGELALLDVASATAALRRYPGRIKVLGPVSPPLAVVAAFRREAPELRQAFDRFLEEARRDGTFDQLVDRYLPELEAQPGQPAGGGR